jgi:hypothetical protein
LKPSVPVIGTRKCFTVRTRQVRSSLDSAAAFKWLSSAARRCDLSPRGKSKHKEVRYLDIHEDDQFDEAQVATWIRQAAALPGWVP